MRAAGEDEVEKLLRLLNERRKGIIERISGGGAPADNVVGGYLHSAGQVLGLTDAENLIKEVFRPWAGEPIAPLTTKPRSGDY